MVQTLFRICVFPRARSVDGQAGGTEIMVTTRRVEGNLCTSANGCAYSTDLWRVF